MATLSILTDFEPFLAVPTLTPLVGINVIQNALFHVQLEKQHLLSLLDKHRLFYVALSFPLGHSHGAYELVSRLFRYRDDQWFFLYANLLVLACLNLFAVPDQRSL